MTSYVSEILIPTKMGLVSSVKWLVEHKYKFTKGSIKGDFYKFKQNKNSKTIYDENIK